MGLWETLTMLRVYCKTMGFADGRLFDQGLQNLHPQKPGRSREGDVQISCFGLSRPLAACEAAGYACLLLPVDCLGEGLGSSSRHQ